MFLFLHPLDILQDQLCRIFQRDFCRIDHQIIILGISPDPIRIVIIVTSPGLIFQLHFFQRHITVEIMTSFFAKFIRCVDKNMITVFLICQHRICTSSKENSSG